MSEKKPSIITEDSENNTRLTARHLYWTGWKVSRISEHLSISPTTIHSWKSRDGWDKATPLDKAAGSIESRYVAIVMKDKKSNGDYKELDELGRQMERLARIGKYNETGKESDINPKIKKRNEAPRKKIKNDFGEENNKLLQDSFESSLFDFQKDWFNFGQTEKIRNLLKSRRIGATWFFAREAFVDALITGKNKVFISASKNQALQFLSYMRKFVLDTTGCELKGNDKGVFLPNGAEILFLGTNKNTAQGYEGDLYFDEYFWTSGFHDLQIAVSGNAAHAQFSQTYFSTPSSVSHEAYPFWTGADFNKGRPRNQRAHFDLTHQALKGGQRGADYQFRQIVTIEDALAGGCDLFDIDFLRATTPPDAYANKFMCEFMDDSTSSFPMSFMRRCTVDTFDHPNWRDFKEFTPRPLGDHPVWIGYDPAGKEDGSDGAGLVILAPSFDKNFPHRIIERRRIFGNDFESQAETIHEVLYRYNVTNIAIDTTGLGESVAQYVDKFFPEVKRIQYNPDVKSSLVRQAQFVISKNRLQYDNGWTDITQSFSSIRRAVTKSGRYVTYTGGRSEETGHADLAWATMHALSFEPITGPDDGSESYMEIL